MPAATTDRNTRRRGSDVRTLPVAANTMIPAGIIAAVNAAGHMVNAGEASAVRVVGYTQSRSDNTDGVAGTLMHPAWRGVAGPFHTGSGADQVGAADVGALCYVIDNQTVARVDGGTGRLAAGRVWAVEDGGVYVLFD